MEQLEEIKSFWITPKNLGDKLVPVRSAYADIRWLASRVEELERALHLALAVTEDDPILVTEPEKEIYRLCEQLRGLRESVIASAFESHVQLLHGADYEVCDNPFCKFAYALEQQKAKAE